MNRIFVFVLVGLIVFCILYFTVYKKGGRPIVRSQLYYIQVMTDPGLDISRGPSELKLGLYNSYSYPDTLINNDYGVITLSSDNLYKRKPIIVNGHRASIEDVIVSITNEELKLWDGMIVVTLLDSEENPITRPQYYHTSLYLKNGNIQYICPNGEITDNLGAAKLACVNEEYFSLSANTLFKND